MVKVYINEKEFDIEPGKTILEACKQAEEEIPVFCYHKKLSIAGNCRMCLVEVKGASKPVASCAMPVREGMEVFTKNPFVKEVRKGNLELLLINHPLDCPICDQGGECDLQDITMAYGPSASRFQENKRAVSDKYLGPLIKTSMNRCIHCTRCVRFMEEVGGGAEIGAFGRGENVEISTYLEKAVRSELSGNIIDLCPVGALTSKPYAYTGRPWELENFESIDIHDAIGSNTQIDIRDGKVMRILPRFNEDVNEEWISDKARFSYDGLSLQRLDRPYVRRNGWLQETSWDEAFDVIIGQLSRSHANAIAALSGPLVDVETQFLMKKLLDSMQVPHCDAADSLSHLPFSAREDYLFNSGLAGIESSDTCLIVGSNPRVEAPILNARLLKAVRQGTLKVFMIGQKVDLGYPYEYLGDKATLLNKILQKKHGLSSVLGSSRRPSLILGRGALESSEGSAIYKTCGALSKEFSLVSEDWNGFNILHTAASHVGGLDVGFTASSKGSYRKNEILREAEQGNMSLVFLLGVDSLPRETLGSSMVVYIGHHGDEGAHGADVILPGAAFSEKAATYVNTEGRVQRTQKAINPPRRAKEDWKIIKRFAGLIGINLPYNKAEDVWTALEEIHSAYKMPNLMPPSDLSWRPSCDKLSSVRRGIMNPSLDNFYMSDVISRNSTTMAACVREILKGEKEDQPFKRGGF